MEKRILKRSRRFFNELLSILGLPSDYEVFRV